MIVPIITSITFLSLRYICSLFASYNGIEKYNWEYGADGRIGLHNDLVNDVTWRYEYTKDGSLTSAYGTNGEDASLIESVVLPAAIAYRTN